MKSKISWIKPRKKMIFALLIDLFLYSLFFIIFYLYDKNLRLSNYLVYFFTWINFSYCLGRYHHYLEERNFLLIKIIYKSIILIIFTTFISTLTLFILSNFSDFNYHFSYKFLFIIFLGSNFFQYLYCLITNIISIPQRWLYIGNELSFRRIKKELEENKLDQEIKLVNRDSLKSNLNFNNFTGIIKDIYDTKNTENLNIYRLKKNCIDVIDILDWYENIFQRIPHDLIDDKYVIKNFFNKKNTNYSTRIKRLGDIFLSTFILLISAPLIFFAAIFIWLEDKGPIFYSQTRNGYKGSKIKIIKLRTMIKNAEKKTGASWSKRSDDRVTRIGKILRETRIDELPQLISVLNGNMSLIGPRPERDIFERKILKEAKFYNLRHTVRPGLSGWAQVNYPYGASIKDSINKLSFDLYYIKYYSIMLDFLIFFKTIKLLFNKQGSEPKD